MLRQPFPDNQLDKLISTDWKNPNVAWKTGTSTGYHDAWSVIYNEHYVVGVWLGNNDSRASTYLVGAQAALPLASAIFKTLPASSTVTPVVNAPALHRVSTCPESGLPVSQACPTSSSVQLPKNISTKRICQVHRRNYATNTVTTHWPGAADAWDLANIPLTSTSLREPIALAIESPAHQTQFVLTGVSGGDKIRLKSSLDNLTKVHWYQNDHYLGHTGPNKPLLIPLSRGEFTLSCWSPNSGAQKIQYTVHEPEAG